MSLFEQLPYRFQRRIISSLTSSFNNTACWLWTGEINRNGYGRVWWKQKRRVAHRAVWEAVLGDIPPGLILDHRCRCRACVNPEHTEPVTHKVNTERGEAVLFRKRS